MRVHPKAQCFFCNGHWPFTKKINDNFITLCKEAVFTNITLQLCVSIANYIKYENKLLGKGYGTIVNWYYREDLGCTFLVHFASVSPPLPHWLS